MANFFPIGYKAEHLDQNILILRAGDIKFVLKLKFNVTLQK